MFILVFLPGLILSQVRIGLSQRCTNKDLCVDGATCCFGSIADFKAGTKTCFLSSNCLKIEVVNSTFLPKNSNSQSSSSSFSIQAKTSPTGPNVSLSGQSLVTMTVLPPQIETVITTTKTENNQATDTSYTSLPTQIDLQNSNSAIDKPQSNASPIPGPTPDTSQDQRSISNGIPNYIGLVSGIVAFIMISGLVFIFVARNNKRKNGIEFNDFEAHPNHKAANFYTSPRKTLNFEDKQSFVPVFSPVDPISHSPFKTQTDIKSPPPPTSAQSNHEVLMNIPLPPIPYPYDPKSQPQRPMSPIPESQLTLDFNQANRVRRASSIMSKMTIFPTFQKSNPPPGPLSPLYETVQREDLSKYANYYSIIRPPVSTMRRRSSVSEHKIN